MIKVDKEYLEYRRACFRDDAEKAKIHFLKYPASVADIRCEPQEYELVREVFREVLDGKQFQRCKFLLK